MAGVVERGAQWATSALAKWRRRGREQECDPSLVNSVEADLRRTIDRGIRVTGQRRSRSDCLILWAGDGPRYVVKVALTDAGELRLRRNVAALTAIREGSWSMPFSGRIPEIVHVGSAAGRFYSVEASLPGRDGREWAGSEGSLDHSMVAGATFLREFHAASKRASTLDQAAWAREVKPAIEAVVELAAIHSAADGYRRMCAELEQALVGRGIRLVFAHGDFWGGNLLFQRQSLSGVVDWDHASQEGLPLVDLVFLIHRTESLRSGMSLGEAVVAWMSGGAPSSAMRLIEEYCESFELPLALLGPIVFVSWLQHVHAHFRFGSSVLSSPRWLRRNLLNVLQSVAPEA